MSSEHLASRCEQGQSIGIHLKQMLSIWGRIGRKMSDAEIAEIVSVRDEMAERSRELDDDTYKLIAAGYALVAMAAAPENYGKELSANIIIIVGALSQYSRAVREGEWRARHDDLITAISDPSQAHVLPLAHGTIMRTVLQIPRCEASLEWSAAISLLMIADIKQEQRSCEIVYAKYAAVQAQFAKCDEARRDLGREIVASICRIQFTIETALGLEAYIDETGQVRHRAKME